MHMREAGADKATIAQGLVDTNSMRVTDRNCAYSAKYVVDFECHAVDAAAVVEISGLVQPPW